MNQPINSSHHRHSIRLPWYDYSRAGAYYVTMVTAGRECVFGTVGEGGMQLSSVGEIVRREWERLPERFVGVGLGAYVIMPNHVHGIIVIEEEDRGTARRAPTASGDPMASRAPKNGAPTVERFGKPVAGSIPTIVRSYNLR